MSDTDFTPPTLNAAVIAASKRYLPSAFNTLAYFQEDFAADPFRALEMRTDLHVSAARIKVWGEICRKILQGEETVRKIADRIDSEIEGMTSRIGDSNYLTKLGLAHLQALSEARQSLQWAIKDDDLYARWAENDAAKKAAAEAQEAA
ncbi:hypothetical protein BB934_45430 (plasmid) [Microvirga ossetica]|uniref:Uncharacterized protein n=1 Tax=Microvirga ossetica TaxID=1882682 RepID=A0A1B2EZV0_9HYPH|nr:hypothetical protein [Microvirga ossetica]ANY85464.1 hypothetical protein BB934_45430 [Microvirga ossetica]